MSTCKSVLCSECPKPYHASMLWHPRTRPDSQLMLCMQGACWMHRMREGF